MRRPVFPVVAAGILVGLILLFVFQRPPRRPDPPGLGVTLLAWLSESGQGTESVHPFRDAGGAWHIRIDIQAGRYAALVPGLEAEIARRDARIASRVEEARDGAHRFLWDVRGKEGGASSTALLLFICPTGAAPAPTSPAVRKPLVSIIVDDAGYNLDLIRDLAGIGLPLTIAILPNAPLAAETAGLAARSGLEVMIHLPLEAENAAAGAPADPAGIIRPGMDAATVKRIVADALVRVPGACGLNNHAGSRATEDAAVMMSLVEAVGERGLYFVDSRTTRDSLAYSAAGALAVPAAERRVFLDQPPGRATVEARLGELFAAARKRGTAVGIGHAKRETVDALRAFLGRAEAEGVELVFASAVVR
jgi:polysaccharide deacetylase 2 family uncharacterized protein YibQ